MNTLILLSSFILSCGYSPPKAKLNQPTQSHETAIHRNGVRYDTVNRPFQVIFKDISKVHNESPYNQCQIEISGTNKIQLPQANWQDKLAWSEDSKKLILIKWEKQSATPVFRFLIVDTNSGVTREGVRMLGAINDLYIRGDTIHYNKFYPNRALSKDTLCCYIQEKYIISSL